MFGAGTGLLKDVRKLNLIYLFREQDIIQDWKRLCSETLMPVNNFQK